MTNIVRFPAEVLARRAKRIAEKYGRRRRPMTAETFHRPWADWHGRMAEKRERWQGREIAPYVIYDEAGEITPESWDELVKRDEWIHFTPPPTQETPGMPKPPLLTLKNLKPIVAAMDSTRVFVDSAAPKGLIEQGYETLLVALKLPVINVAWAPEDEKLQEQHLAGCFVETLFQQAAKSVAAMCQADERVDAEGTLKVALYLIEKASDHKMVSEELEPVYRAMNSLYHTQIVSNSIPF